MKIILTSIVSLLFAFGFAGCPSKAINSKEVVGFDSESKILTVAMGKKRVTSESKTEMVGFDCTSKLTKDTRVSIEGCSCKNKTASRFPSKKEKRRQVNSLQLFFTGPPCEGFFLSGLILFFKKFHHLDQTKQAGTNKAVATTAIELVGRQIEPMSQMKTTD